MEHVQRLSPNGRVKPQAFGGRKILILVDNFLSVCYYKYILKKE
ncbi:hypothetical protein [Staphylococcus phage PT94]